MCLGIPMQISRREGLSSVCVARGVEREVSLALVEHESLAVGDYVLVHLGYAIQKISAADAAITWGLLEQLTVAEG